MVYPNPEAFNSCEMKFVASILGPVVLRSNEQGLYKALASISTQLNKLYLPQIEDLFKIVRAIGRQAPYLLATPTYICRERELTIISRLPHTGGQEYPFVLIAEWGDKLVALRTLYRMGISPEQNYSNLRITGLGRAAATEIPVSRGMLMAVYN